jgi:short-chain Z-isoprenyl diphosphate synthase
MRWAVGPRQRPGDARVADLVARICALIISVDRNRPKMVIKGFVMAFERAEAETGDAARLPRLRVRGVRGRLAAVLLAPLYRVYTARLRRKVRLVAPPNHVAVILDGNRRWANLAGLPEPGAGHRRGADKIDELLSWCAELRIGEVTVWALSNENLARSPAELSALHEIVADKLIALAERARRQAPQMRIRIFGRLEALPDRLRKTIDQVEADTAGHEGLTLNIALGYSGRDELVDATRALIRSLAAQGVSAEEMVDHVSSEALANNLYTAEHSDPDLIIRTSGEMRLSGFLPWQSTHSEFYFTDVYWPAFRELDFLRAVRTFQQRERRFGR